MKKNLELEKRMREKIKNETSEMSDELINVFINSTLENCSQELEEKIWKWIGQKQ